MNKGIDGHIPLANLVGGRLEGKIYGDKRGRFEDGDDIITSTVVDLKWTRQGILVKTKNSLYLCLEVRV